MSDGHDDNPPVGELEQAQIQEIPPEEETQEQTGESSRAQGKGKKKATALPRKQSKRIAGKKAAEQESESSLFAKKKEELEKLAAQLERNQELFNIEKMKILPTTTRRKW